MKKISPVITTPIAVAAIIVGIWLLTTPRAHANHDHWTRAWQGNDVTKVYAVGGNVKVCDKESDGHHVIGEIAYLNKDGKQVVVKWKDENGSDPGCSKHNVGAYAATSFRTGENTGKKNLFGDWIYNFGEQKVIVYSDRRR